MTNGGFSKGGPQKPYFFLSPRLYNIYDKFFPKTGVQTWEQKDSPETFGYPFFKEAFMGKLFPALPPSSNDPSISTSAHTPPPKLSTFYTPKIYTFHHL